MKENEKLLQEEKTTKGFNEFFMNSELGREINTNYEFLAKMKIKRIHVDRAKTLNVINNHQQND